MDTITIRAYKNYRGSYYAWTRFPASNFINDWPRNSVYEPFGRTHTIYVPLVVRQR